MLIAEETKYITFNYQSFLFTIYLVLKLCYLTKKLKRALETPSLFIFLKQSPFPTKSISITNLCTKNDRNMMKVASYIKICKITIWWQYLVLRHLTFGTPCSFHRNLVRFYGQPLKTHLLFCSFSLI